MDIETAFAKAVEAVETEGARDLRATFARTMAAIDALSDALANAGMRSAVWMDFPGERELTIPVIRVEGRVFVVPETREDMARSVEQAGIVSERDEAEFAALLRSLPLTADGLVDVTDVGADWDDAILESRETILREQGDD